VVEFVATALCLVFLELESLARRYGSASTKAFDHLLFSQFPVCNWRLKASIVRFFPIKQVSAPDPESVQTQKTRQRQTQKWRCRSWGEGFFWLLN
jgi:hypothetical protein